jgi:4'-phosphopantetheinyl transferase
VARDEEGPSRVLGTEVHVWTLVPERLSPSKLEDLHSLLDADERRRIGRVRVERARLQRLVTRGLLRSVLSRYVQVSPRSWRFEARRHGRPELVPGQCEVDLRFNVSHTEGLVACAVAQGREVGVDVEWTRRKGRTVSIAEEFFSPAEVRDLRAVPPEARRERFFDYWTLKEAYVKARGAGLSLPLRRFTFHLDGAGEIRISFDPRIDDDPGSWRFRLCRPVQHHVLALAVRRAPGVDGPVRLEEWLV